MKLRGVNYIRMVENNPYILHLMQNVFIKNTGLSLLGITAIILPLPKPICLAFKWSYTF